MKYNSEQHLKEARGQFDRLANCGIAIAIVSTIIVLIVVLS